MWRRPLMVLAVATGCSGDPAAAIDASAIDGAIDGAIVDGGVDAVPGDGPVDATVDAQLWPPTDVGIAIGAVAAGDVDGDGRDDLLLALWTGQSGLHVFRGGGVDLDDHGAVIGTPDWAETFVGAPPMALAMYDGLPVMVSAGFGTMVVFDHDLSLYSSRQLPFSVMQDHTIELSEIVYGASGALAIATPAGLYAIDRAHLRDNPPTVTALSQPPVSFADVRGAGSDAVGTLVVAEATKIALGTPSPTAGGPHTWVQRTLTGAPWAAELVADVTGDGRPDVIGYRKPVTGSAELCVHDGADAPGSQPTCRILPGQNAERAVLLLDQLDGSAGLDLIVATTILPGPGLGLIEAYPDFHVATGAITTGTRRTLMVPRAPGWLVGIDVGGDGRKELMMVEGTGALRCAKLSPAGFGDC